MLGFGDCLAELFIRFPMPCIEPVVTGHLEMFFGDMLYEKGNEGAVIEEERAQVFINGKNEVPVGTINEFKGHFSRAVGAVFITAGGTKFGMAAERDKFKVPAVGTAIHRTTKRRITLVDHFFNFFHDNRMWMEDIFNFFIVVFKNLLEDIHKAIMKE